jgi:hypothetical protein
MRYLLRKDVIGRVPEIDITEARYLEYDNARVVLLNCLAIEEKYEIVISNYLGLEKEMLDAAISHMVRAHPDYPDFFQFRLGLNTRLVNLLTATRLYTDQLARNVSACLPGDEKVEDAVKALFSKEYDGHWEYRFMEALRNFVQHRGMPVHWTQMRGKRTSFEEDGLLEFSVEMAAVRSFFEEDGEFKKSVLDDMREKVDLKSATRCYIECISNVHCAVREMVRHSASASRELIEDAHSQYAKVCDQSLVGLSACAWSDDGERVSSVPLLLDWDDLRLKLIDRNGKMTNLRKRYVTSRIMGCDQ